MLESVAKLCWCPFARVRIGDDAPSWNRMKMTELGAADPRCIASECMAWRWIDALTVPQKDRRGCCGLAGRP